MSEDTSKKTIQDSVQEPQVEEIKKEVVKETVDTTEDSSVEDTVSTNEPTEDTQEDAITTTEEVVVEDVSKDTASSNKKDIPDFRSGDTVKVHYKIIEGNKVRTQPYEGIVIARKGKEMSKTFTVRRIGADKIGVERIFPLFSPNIEKIDILKRGKVRRSKLYYLRDKQGREAMRIRELGK